MNEMKPADQKQKTVPYGGYYKNQIPEYDPTLTETGPGTPFFVALETEDALGDEKQRPSQFRQLYLGAVAREEFDAVIVLQGFYMGGDARLADALRLRGLGETAFHGDPVETA